MQSSELLEPLTKKSHAKSIRLSATRAALSSGVSGLINRSLTIVLSIATARALGPGEVGLLGLATIIVAIISMIGYYPELACIAAKGKDRDEHYAWVAVMIRAILITILIVTLVLWFPVISGWLAERENLLDKLQTLTNIMLLSPIFELLASYPRSLLQRRLDLSFVALTGGLQSLIFVVTAVILLWYGVGYLGVAWASLLGTSIATLCLWLRLLKKNWLLWAGWPSAPAWREISVGSARIFTGGMGGFLGERIDNLLVSNILGPSAMSYYSLAWNGARAPANIFGASIGFVLVPTLANIKNDINRVGQVFRNSLRHTYLLLAPVCSLMLVSAPLLVTYVLGPKWLPLVFCLRVMCLTVLVIPLLHAMNAMLVWAGRAHLTGIATSVHIAALFIAMPVFAQRWGLSGAALGDLFAMSLLSLTLYLITRVSYRQLVIITPSIFFLPVISSLIAAFLAWNIGRQIVFPGLRLFTEILVSLAGYVAFVYLLGGKDKLLDLKDLLCSVMRTATTA